MRVFDVPESLKPVLKTLKYAISLIAILWSIGFLVTRTSVVLNFYRMAFGAQFSHYIAGQLARAQSTDRPPVLIIGPSSVQQGIQEQVLEKVHPDYHFFNCGVGGGGITSLGPATMLIDQYNVRPHMIVIGLHPLQLRERIAFLSSQRTTDFMDLWTGWDLLEGEDWNRFVLYEATSNTIYPGLRLARQTNNLIRYAIFRIQSALPFRHPLPRSAFELMAEELRPYSTLSLVSSDPLSPQKAADLIEIYKENQSYTPNLYGQPTQVQILRRILDKSLKATPNVIIAIMPEHSYIRNSFGKYGKEKLREMLDEYKGKGCHIVDLSESIPDTQFADHLHPTIIGSQTGSYKMAEAITPYLRPLPLKITNSAGLNGE